MNCLESVETHFQFKYYTNWMNFEISISGWKKSVVQNLLKCTKMHFGFWILMTIFGKKNWCEFYQVKSVLFHWGGGGPKIKGYSEWPGFRNFWSATYVEYWTFFYNCPQTTNQPDRQTDGHYSDQISHSVRQTTRLKIWNSSPLYELIQSQQYLRFVTKTTDQIRSSPMFHAIFISDTEATHWLDGW